VTPASHRSQPMHGTDPLPVIDEMSSTSERTTSRQGPSVLCVAAVTFALFAYGAATHPAKADESAAPHRVRYTVTSDAPTDSQIFYHDVDPPSWAAYSHNPYQFTPEANATIGPDRPWVLEVTLDDPFSWAMVVVTQGISSQAAKFHCSLQLDGAVVATNSGPKGALCSIRSW
jgi:hypothetical protein